MCLANDYMIYCTNVYPFTRLTADSILQTMKGWRSNSSGMLWSIIGCSSYLSFRGSQCLHSNGRQSRRISTHLPNDKAYHPTWLASLATLLWEPQTLNEQNCGQIWYGNLGISNLLALRIGNFELPASTRLESVL